MCKVKSVNNKTKIENLDKNWKSWFNFKNEKCNILLYTCILSLYLVRQEFYLDSTTFKISCASNIIPLICYFNIYVIFLSFFFSFYVIFSLILKPATKRRWTFYIIIVIIASKICKHSWTIRIASVIKLCVDGSNWNS